MILVDTGYFLAVFNQADELHSRAVAWAGEIHEDLIVTEYILWECFNSLSRPVDRLAAQTLVAYVRHKRGYTIVDASRALFESGIQLHGDRPDKEWSLTDCVSFNLMKELGITRALTYDHHFEQAGFQALLRQDPQ